ncbi:MAG: MFS transporter [Cyanothece sp. SIO2G6]|nr:MFS transporter [Cyanothece sp. SIO2G6]
MRIFIQIWCGQMVSTIGSYMTFFSLMLWAWDATGSATALALVGFFSQLPSIAITLVSGLIVDRFNRKYLMLLGDAIAALSTVIVGSLYLTDNLQIWHLYGVAALNSGFNQLQLLAYKASISSIVPPAQLTRANSMNTIVHYGSSIVGPALAGVLYPAIGLKGILGIDLLSFGVAFVTLITAVIPQSMSNTTAVKSPHQEPLLDKLTFGFRVIWQQASLRSLLLVTTLFWFFHDLGGAIYSPMILARTDGSSAILASTSAAAGVGGVTGAILLSIWGGPKRRIVGMLAGFIGAGLSKTVFGLGRSPFVWLPAQLCSSLNFPLLGSSENAIWMARISPEMQGRVFAANALALRSVSAIAVLTAGPLADQIFEPMVQSGSVLATLSNPIIGTGAGAGIALLYVITSIGLLITGTAGCFLPHLLNVEQSAAKE